MLKFLEGRQKQNTARPSITKTPHLTFGISLDSPTTFQTKYSVFSPSSFVNPYSKIQTERLQHIPLNKRRNISPNWTQKNDISQVEEGKVIGSGDLNPVSNRYHETYRAQLQKNSSRFRLSKGQFTNHLQRTHLNTICFGPLTGEERSNDKYLQTKRSIMKKSALNLQKSRQKLQLTQSMRKQSTRYLQKMIDEKRSIRQQRDMFYNTIRLDMSEQKQSHRSFHLPKVITQRQKIKPHNKQLDFGIFRTIDNSILSNYIKTND